MNLRLRPMHKLSFDKRRIKFLFLEGIHANATDALTHDGYASCRSLPKSLAGDALKAALKDVHFLGIRSRSEITAEMLAESDVVTLHVPETAQTKNLIGRAQFAAMKKGAHLINAARGTVVDIDALADALERGQLGGAAIDVFPEEPKGNDEEFRSPLRKFDNVILTPHIGGSTVEAQANIGTEVADKLIRYSNNGTTVTAVNFPEVTLPEHAGTGKSRLLHIHRNIPGVLAHINERFSQHRVNISAQYLQTNEHIGYCVMDVDASASEIAIDELQSVPGTIRARLLY